MDTPIGCDLVCVSCPMPGDSSAIMAASVTTFAYGIQQKLPIFMTHLVCRPALPSHVPIGEAEFSAAGASGLRHDK